MSESQLVEKTLSQKQQQLLAVVADYGPTVVAFSGGVDSAVVARAVFEVQGDRCLAATAVSPSLAQGELEEARDVAQRIGIAHAVVSTDEFAVEGYRKNAGDRCFYCKSELYSVLRSRFPEDEFPTVVNGANLDDLGDHRPGMQAAVQFHVRSPLIEAGLTKSDVRQLAQTWGLPIWDKPAMPCLSSRIAHGVEVTPQRTQRVNAAESFLKQALNIRELRVRHEANDLARIEVPLAALSRFVDENFRTQLIDEFHRLGFRYVTLDLEGFRSGSLNLALPLIELQTVQRSEQPEA